MENSKIYDLIIVGAGPAGLTSSIYASCFHLKHLVIGATVGGQLQFAPHILNYPGFTNISGKDLTERLVSQVKEMGGRLVTESVTKITKSKIQMTNQTQNSNYQNYEYFRLDTQERNSYHTQAIILATGTERRKLNIPGEVEYTSKGVHYCATCEQFDYKGKICAVIGGANSAVQAAVELAQAAKKVYVIYRGSVLRGDPIWLGQIEKTKNIEVIYNTQVLEIKGDGKMVKGVVLKRNPENQRDPSTRPATAGLAQDDNLYIEKVFIEIGGVPGTALVIPLGVKMDPGGYIIVDETLSTNIAGIFAAGDLVSYGLSIEQISSAVGLGARAASTAFAYLKNNKAPILWGQSQIKR